MTLFVRHNENEYIHRWGKRIQTEMKTYGKVIGVFERKRYDKIPHPVLVCELDRFDNNKAEAFNGFHGFQCI
jgi:hypothetical protein